MSRVRSLLRRRAADPLPQEAPDAVAVAPEPVAADPDPRGWDVAPPERTPAVAPAELPELVAEVDPTPSTEPAEPAELAEPKTAPPMGWGAVHVGGGDLVALSHAYAAAGRLHEAALAQWAADLQLVAPHLGSRAAELCDAVESLSPLDPQSALTAARAALASLVDEDVPVLSLLGPTSHLADRSGASLRPRQMHQERRRAARGRAARARRHPGGCRSPGR